MDFSRTVLTVVGSYNSYCSLLLIDSQKFICSPMTRVVTLIVNIHFVQICKLSEYLLALDYKWDVDRIPLIFHLPVTGQK
jgi:hypothetical protein